MFPIVPILLTGSVVALTAYLGSRAGGGSPAPGPPAPGPPAPGPPAPGPAPAPAPAPEPGPEPLPHEEPSAAGYLHPRTGQMFPPGADYGSFTSVVTPTPLYATPGGGTTGVSLAFGQQVFVHGSVSGTPGGSGWCLIETAVFDLSAPAPTGVQHVSGWVPCSALAPPTIGVQPGYPQIYGTPMGPGYLQYAPSFRPGGRPHPFFRGPFHHGAPGALAHPGGHGFGAPGGRGFGAPGGRGFGAPGGRGFGAPGGHGFAPHPAAAPHRTPFARPTPQGSASASAPPSGQASAFSRPAVPGGSTSAHAVPTPMGSASAHAGPSPFSRPAAPGGMASAFARPAPVARRFG